MYPDVIIAGAKKCGTGALIKMLGQHPRVAASGREQHFLDQNFHMGWHFYSDSLLRTSNWEPGKVLMEKTPSYFIDPEVPRRIDLVSGHQKKMTGIARYFLPTARSKSGADPLQSCHQDAVRHGDVLP